MENVSITSFRFFSLFLVKNLGSGCRFDGGKKCRLDEVISPWENTLGIFHEQSVTKIILSRGPRAYGTCTLCTGSVEFEDITVYKCFTGCTLRRIS